MKSNGEDPFPDEEILYLDEDPLPDEETLNEEECDLL